ncbi:hypothetical protein ACPDHL_09980 [Myroides sp. C15-4]|uniref:hypothetical protein n=1 Tax=Myroides sp. C15-4 TaxID=3400532 RepID=UPI003D2F7820
MKTQHFLELGKQQVQDFCIDIEIWFNGTASDPNALYEKILASFDPAFILMNGDGHTIDFPSLTQWLQGVYGQFPTRKVTLQNLTGNATTQHILLTYTEIQVTDGIQNTRQASAIFRLHDNQALWYHLVEKWVM